MSEKLEFTGERFTPECVREIWYEHVHRYVFASGLVKGLRVLDAACGEGYGSALLATQARSVVGVDISAEAIGHARNRYGVDNLEFQEADCLELPFDDHEFDCIISFETLEHLEDHERLLSGFRRVLKPQGFLLLSSPDKAVYTDRMKNDNEFHVKELYRGEFEDLVSRHFPACRLWGQKLLFHSVLWSLQASQGLRLNQEKQGELTQSVIPAHDPVYLLALCADSERSLPSTDHGLSLFDDSQESVYRHYDHEIRKNMSTGAILIEKDQEIAELKTRLAEAGAGGNWWRRLFGGK